MIGNCNMFKKIIYLIMTIFLLSSCASMMRGDGEVVFISSNIEKTNIKIVNSIGNTIFQGQTPTSVYLLNKESVKGYTLYATKDGYSDIKTEIGSKDSNWATAGNAIFLFPMGLIGLSIDIATNKAFYPDNENINLHMTPKLYD